MNPIPIILGAIAFLACLQGIKTGQKYNQMQDVSPTGRHGHHGPSIALSKPATLGTLPRKGLELPWFIVEAQTKQ